MVVFAFLLLPLLLWEYTTIIFFFFLYSESAGMEWDDWTHKPGLTYLSLVRSPGPSVVLFVHYQ